MPVWIDDGKRRPWPSYFPCEPCGELWRRLQAALELHDHRHSRDVELALPEPKPEALGAAWSTILWCWVEGKDQVWRAGTQFSPAPTMVLRIGEGSKRLLLWWLKEPIAHGEIEPANRKIAYALHAKQKLGHPGELRIPLPGSLIRVDRARPASVVVTRLTDDTYTCRRIVGQLREPPDRDAWRERRQ